MPCDVCGADGDAPHRLALEWPADEPDDPGEGVLRACGDCADAVATHVLVDRAVTRGEGDVYDGLRPVEAGEA